MKYYDSHVHTDISHDGVSSMASYELAAPKKFVKGITYTEHYDLYDGVQTKIMPLNIEKYINTYNSIKHLEDSHIGLEAGLRSTYMKEIFMQLGKYIDSFDFIIGSSHIVCDKDIAYDNSFFEGITPEESINNYFYDVLENIKTFNELFDVYGHLDHIVRYASKYHGPDYKFIKYQDYKKVLDEILVLLIKNNKGLEINTSGVRKGLPSFHPNEQILSRYYDLGGRIVTTGSDAHMVGDLAANFDEAYDVLERCGFKEVATYERRNPVFRKIKDLRK